MTLVASITLLGPAMLAGAALVALPVVAHLLHRNARRPVVFPSIRLLKASAASQSSLFRLRRRLLLLVRSLAVICLALAFSEPLWSRAYAATDGSAGSVVLVLDASLSTRRLDGASSIFERLRGQAAAVVEGLDGGRDRADVIVADASPHALVGELTPNLAMLGEMIGTVSPSAARADLATAIRRAGQMLADADGRREIVLVTDGQSTNWADLAESSGSEGSAGIGAILPPGTRVRVVEPIAADGPNVGLESRGMSASRVAPGQAVAVRVRARAFGEPADVTLRLALDGRPMEVRPITVAPGSPRDEVFQVRATEGGSHSVTVTSERDALAEDDVVHFAFDVGGRQPVLILSDEDPADPSRATYFLLRALAPYGDARDRFAPRVTPVAELSSTALADVRSVLVADITRLDASHASLLRTHLERAGSIVLFAGGGAIAENLALLESTMPGLLPFVPGATTGREAKLIAGAARRSALASFDEAAFLGLGQIRVGRVRACTGVRDDALHVLAFDDGTPALSLRRFGEGTFALANFSASPRAGDLGRHGAFVALVQSLAAELGPADGTSEAMTVGTPLTIACGVPNASLRVIAPDGSALENAVILEGRGDVSVTIDRPTQAGIYAVEAAGRRIAAAAVNVDPRESDPRPLSATSIVAAMGGEPAPEAAGGAGPAPVGRTARDGTPLWWAALLAALSLVCAELALLAFWRR